MKIKTNKRIQDEVDKRRGHAITHLTALHACAVGYANDGCVENSSEVAIDAFANGVQNGVGLFQDFIKAMKKEIETGTKKVLGLFSKPVSADFDIYVATQDTSDGRDYLYFIGTPDSIVEKLRKVPATEK